MIFARHAKQEKCSWYYICDVYILAENSEYAHFSHLTVLG